MRSGTSHRFSFTLYKPIGPLNVLIRMAECQADQNDFDDLKCPENEEEEIEYTKG